MHTNPTEKLCNIPESLTIKTFTSLVWGYLNPEVLHTKDIPLKQRRNPILRPNEISIESYTPDSLFNKFKKE